MQNKVLLNLSLVLLSALVTTFCFGQKPYKEPLEGQLHRYSSFTIGTCEVSDVTAKYRLSTTVGEPTVFLNFKWKATSSAKLDCLDSESFEAFIEVYIGYTKYYIPAAGALGTIPKGDNTWGNDPLSGSPSWSELFLPSLNGITPGNSRNRNYVSEDIAKGYWQSGAFRVTGVVFLDKDGNKNSIN